MPEFDISFKGLTERVPEQALKMFGHGPIGDHTEFRALDREITTPLRAIDYGFFVQDGRRRWVEHFEAEVGYSASDRNAILRRAALLHHNLEVPVWTTIVLMSPRHGPVHPARVFGGKEGSLKLRPRYVKLWMLPAGPLLRSGNSQALPWVGAMKATHVELAEAIRHIRNVEDSDLRSQLSAEMVALASLQYDEVEVAKIREALSMLTSRQVLEATPIGQELIALGIEEGVRKGIRKGVRQGVKRGEQIGEKRGRLEGLRDSIRYLIESRLPGISDLAWLQQIREQRRLAKIFRDLVAAPDAPAVRAVMARHKASAGRSQA